MSDAQLVRSQAVCPDRIDDVKLARPALDPCTVTLADPEPPWFVLRTLLIILFSTEKTTVKLPERLPTVMTARTLPCAKLEARQRNDVSDSQLDLSQDEKLIRIAAEYVARPMFVPLMVMLLDPVAA